MSVPLYFFWNKDWSEIVVIKTLNGFEPLSLFLSEIKSILCSLDWEYPKKTEKIKTHKINFPISLFEKIAGFNVKDKEIIKILVDLGFGVSKKKLELQLKVPSWRPDITQPIDIVEEIVRIKGYENIEPVDPEKIRFKDTLNNQQKLFHFIQRAIASKGYYETVTWSFTDSKINTFFIRRKNIFAY